MNFLKLLFIFPLISQAAQNIEVIGNANAPVGGTFYMNLVSEPDVLNPISSHEAVASTVNRYIMDGLLTNNSETNAMEPGLAEKFTVSKDGLTYTFHLRKDIKFSDGHPLTSDDVRFSVECVKDPAFKAIHKAPYYGDIEKIETPDAFTIKFKMKRKYFKTLEVLGSGGFTPIVPKHIYGDPSKALNKTVIGSGPYKLEKYETGKSIELVRDPNWWGFKDPRFAGAYKFERIFFRFIKDNNLQMETLKKGQLDFLDFVQPDQFVQKAVGEPFETKIIKHKEINMDASKKTFNFVAWNLKNPLFQDHKVRMALSLLMDRPFMNKTFRFDLSDLATGPSWAGNEVIVDPSVKSLPFDPQKAASLLKKAGWADRDKNGVLEKSIDGKTVEFRFKLLLANRDYEKYFTIYKQELAKAGIDLEIKLVEWAAFVKLLDEQQFDAVTMSWVPGSVEFDLKQIFHSESAKKGGSNFVNYSNPEVDKLIDQAREELNEKKRRTLWRKAYKLIADDLPYTFMFSTKYDLFFTWNYIGMVKGTLKYDRGEGYWWRQP